MALIFLLVKEINEWDLVPFFIQRKILVILKVWSDYNLREPVFLGSEK